MPSFQNDSDWAGEKFKEIAEAYEVLIVRSQLAGGGREGSDSKDDSFKCNGCEKTMKNRHAYKCHIALYPSHRE